MKDLVFKPGATFQHLTLIRKLTAYPEQAKWLCRCECGNEKIAYQSNLGRSTPSCGCKRSENHRKATTTHGHAGNYGRRSAVYRVWASMKERCQNPNTKPWCHYGGRGIKVCERWQSFENFFADMGNPPKGLTLERVNNEGNYEPSNCRWATRREQILNRRPTPLSDTCGKGHKFTEANTHWYTYNGYQCRACKECRKIYESRRPKRRWSKANLHDRSLA